MFWFPAEQLSRFGGVGAKPLDLAALGPYAFILGNDRKIFPQRLENSGCKFSYGNLATGSEIDYLTDSLWRFRRLDESFYRIRHVVEIARWFDIAQANCFISQRLGDDRWNHRARGLARTVGVEGPHSHDRQSEGHIEGLNDLVCANLRGRVRRLALKRMTLIDWNAARRPIDFTGGRMDH